MCFWLFCFQTTKGYIVTKTIRVTRKGLKKEKIRQYVCGLCHWSSITIKRSEKESQQYKRGTRSINHPSSTSARRREKEGENKRKKRIQIRWKNNDTHRRILGNEIVKRQRNQDERSLNTCKRHEINAMLSKNILVDFPSFLNKKNLDKNVFHIHAILGGM